MNKYFRFEIIRRGRDRYYWLFVSVNKRGRRRVLARSARDFRSLEKATQAIDKVRDTEVVVDTTQDRFPLPATSFRVLSGVVPLMVSEFPVEDSSAAEFRVMGRERNGAPTEPATTGPTPPPATAPARHQERGQLGSQAGGGQARGQAGGQAKRAPPRSARATQAESGGHDVARPAASSRPRSEPCAPLRRGHAGRRVAGSRGRAGLGGRAGRARPGGSGRGAPATRRWSAEWSGRLCRERRRGGRLDPRGGERRLGAHRRSVHVR